MFPHYRPWSSQSSPLPPLESDRKPGPIDWIGALFVAAIGVVTILAAFVLAWLFDPGLG